MQEKNRHIESSLVSGEINEVLGAAPAWIIRWGSLLLLGIILLLCALSFLIRYPDIIKGEACMTPVMPPADVVLQPGMAIEAIYVQDGDSVQERQPLLQVRGRGMRDTITSPAAGRVLLQQAIRRNSAFTRATLLVSIIPFGQQYYTTATMPAAGSGNIRIGQRVNISLYRYPRAEYGSISGRVVSKPLPAAGNTVKVVIQPDKGSVTNYNRELEIYQGEKGQAEIITSDKRLVQRIFSFLADF
ncbi:HlyD family efflux transporter periplasmic adaptor subunit [Chitinophaga japonensis]|uniref:HlyD family secretion protein n=1 Tax=Chitinophaga japonensis TaxID=104662 RepID=A0A562SID9_CHIJA|nr:HlyD family efflux transporter periplasmic adaptor subunit [Chitinophaga japonensis]TWI81059.1 HlyD family secretion protein [Chitinophaga japonensis]